MILFKKVKDQYGWLSNMSPHPVGEYKTAEAYFQAMRFDDTTIRDLIKAEKSPMAAKMVAKKHADKMVVVPRSKEDLELMFLTLKKKLECNPELLAALLATGDEVIVEDVSNRPTESGLFWGAYLDADGKLVGENTLGKLWMEIREFNRRSK